MPGPVLSNVVPVSGSAIPKLQVCSLNVTDVAAALKRVIILASYVDIELDEVVYQGTGGAGFSRQYSNASNTVGAIANGFAFTFLRDGGWPDQPTFTVIAYDAAGNEL